MGVAGVFLVVIGGAILIASLQVLVPFYPAARRVKRLIAKGEVEAAEKLALANRRIVRFGVRLGGALGGLGLALVVVAALFGWA